MIRSPLAVRPYSPASIATGAAVVGQRWLVVAFHDLAPCTQRPCQELLLQLAGLGVPRASLLVAPRWQEAEALQELPFFAQWLRSLAEAGHEICPEGEDRRIDAATVAFSAHSAWRRLASSMAGRLRFAASRQAPVLKIAVHPDDLYAHGVRRTLVALLREALEDRIPVTLGELAGRFPMPPARFATSSHV